MNGTRLTIGSLFSGYGGLDLAVEHVFNARTAWHCEWEEAPSKVLAHHWPNIPNYRDVTAVDWATVPPVDIITGGFPCQDVSLAGRRAGMTEGTRSNLWGAMRTAIETIQPTYVVAENVRGLLSAHAESASDMEPGAGLLGDRSGGHLRALGRVLGDLADLGYDTQWCGLRASDVGAPPPPLPGIHPRHPPRCSAPRQLRRRRAGRCPRNVPEWRTGRYGSRGRSSTWWHPSRCRTRGSRCRRSRHPRRQAPDTRT